MNDKIIIEIGSNNLFYGFYESMYSNSDEFLDDEMEITDNLKECLNDDVKFTVEREYTDESYKKYKLDVCSCFRDVYMEKIIDELPYKITENDNFLFEIVDDDENIVCCSPRYNNYYTGKPYWNIETNYNTLQLIKDYTLKLDGCKEYLIDNFTSRDGFISFIKNDIEYWKNLDIKEYDENYIIALLDMLLWLSDDICYDDNIRFRINYDVYDNICKYGYTNVYVYSQGNKYELNEFIKLYDIDIDKVLC